MELMSGGQDRRGTPQVETKAGSMTRRRLSGVALAGGAALAAAACGADTSQTAATSAQPATVR